jgi:ABC-type Fe3+-siderophore transport system permease subunit
MPATLANSWLLLMLILGLAGTVAAYLAYRDGTAREAPSHEPPEEYPPDIQVSHGRVPRVLIALYLCMGLGMVGYVLYVWLTKPAI